MKYVGSELELFSEATNWKNYFSKVLSGFIEGDVLEVGAGIGETTQFLYKNNEKINSWVSLEPDTEFTENLAKNSFYIEKNIEVVSGTVESSNLNKKFDTILYIDVLEHIENDKSELEKVAKLLKKDGKIIVLSPAHNSLYSPFDKSVGHFRRYDKKNMASATPNNLKIMKLKYLDSLGVILSFVNRIFLKQSMPNKSQISFWDKVIVPMSRVLDRLLFFCVGKTIIGIWKLSE